jgi:hypothetical protein
MFWFTSNGKSKIPGPQVTLTVEFLVHKYHPCHIGTSRRLGTNPHLASGAWLTPPAVSKNISLRHWLGEEDLSASYIHKDWGQGVSVHHIVFTKQKGVYSFGSNLGTDPDRLAANNLYYLYVFCQSMNFTTD